MVSVFFFLLGFCNLFGTFEYGNCKKGGEGGGGELKIEGEKENCFFPLVSVFLYVNLNPRYDFS